MTREIQVTVSGPGWQETTYRFANGPLRVGRSEACGLSICHESIGRQLCRAWLEADGRTVRVEEYPGLTNPLEYRGRPLRGGISGPRITLSVGPIVLTFAAPGADPVKGGRGRRLRTGLLGAGAVLLLLVLALSQTTAPATRPPLPLTPSFPRAQEPSGKGNLRELASLARSRAQEILGRRDGKVASQLAAYTQLTAAQAAMAAVDPIAEKEVTARIQELEVELTARYKAEVVRLDMLIKEQDQAGIRAQAGKILAYLPAKTGEGVQWLRGLAGVAVDKDRRIP